MLPWSPDGLNTTSDVCFVRMLGNIPCLLPRLHSLQPRGLVEVPMLKHHIMPKANPDLGL